MKNNQKGIQSFFMKRGIKLNPPTIDNNGENEDEDESIKGKTDVTMGGEELVDSDEEVGFKVNFDAIDVKARKKRTKAKIRKEKTNKLKAATDKTKSKAAAEKTKQWGKKRR